MSRYSGRRQTLPVLGLDIGGVLVDRIAENEDTSFFGGRPMETPGVPGALDAVERLGPAFEGRIHIVSKAGPRIEALSRQWLSERGFISEVLPMEHVHFVTDRAHKVPICERLGVTHFVDDRISVLNHLTTVDQRVLFTGGSGTHATVDRHHAPPGITVMESWPPLTRYLLDDVRRYAGAGRRRR